VFVHLGAQVSISDKDIIAIMSTDALDKSKLTAEFLSLQRKLGKVIPVDENEAKSIVITPKSIYLSPVSVLTLHRRCEAGYTDLPSLIAIDADK
jgi:hypothetical protein